MYIYAILFSITVMLYYFIWVKIWYKYIFKYKGFAIFGGVEVFQINFGLWDTQDFACLNSQIIWKYFA